MSTAPLHPRYAEVIDALERAQEAFEQQMAAVPPALVDRVPEQGGWSVTQVVDHLLLVEDGTGRIIGGMLKQLDGTFDENTDPIAPTIAQYQVPIRNSRIDAPDLVQPKGLSFAEAREKQAAARARLIDALRMGSGRALHTTTFPHRVFGDMNGYQWALLAAQHQQRHLSQVADILQQVS